MKKIEIKLKEYNSKTRKGTYVVVKAKGHKTGTYKYHGKPAEIDVIKEYYRRKVIENIPLPPSALKKTKTYIKRTSLQTRGKPIYISETMKKGVGTGLIPDIYNMTTAQYHRAKEQALRPLIVDKQIIKIMAMDQNFNKLINRTEVKIELLGRNKERLVSATRFGLPLNKALQQIKKLVKKGSEISVSSTARELRKIGWLSKPESNIDVTKVRAIRAYVTIRRG